MSRPLLVLGRQGQLARELARLCPEAEGEVVYAGRENADLSLAGEVASLIGRLKPRAVINAAAYTAVDRAETEPDAAFRLNRDMPGEAARACADLGAAFVHVSTDYVFDGTKAEPYVETDPRKPVSVYGRSKAEGEEAIEAAGGAWTVLRTSWVYSAFGANFVRTMLRLAAQRAEVAVVADQIGRPTWARELAEALLQLASRAGEEPRARGLFHFAGSGDASWADFAEQIFARSSGIGGPSARVRRITTAEYPTPARRPANSRLDSGKIGREMGIRPADWRIGLANCLKEFEGVR